MICYGHIWPNYFLFLEFINASIMEETQINFFSFIQIVDDAEREVLGMSQAVVPGFVSRVEGKNSSEEFNKHEIHHEEGILSSKASIISPTLSFLVNMSHFKCHFLQDHYCKNVKIHFITLIDDVECI